MDTKGRLTFSRSRRLQHALEFQGVYEAKTRQTRGPLAVYAMPNGLKRPRLGLSVSRRVGTAPRRNRIKRLLREGFRHVQSDVGGYDFVIVVRPHEPLEAAAYRQMLKELFLKLEKVWSERLG